MVETHIDISKKSSSAEDIDLATEAKNGLESSVNKTIRDHSFYSVISLGSDNSYSTAKAANADLLTRDSEYYPVAGQMIEFVGSDGLLHTCRYNGNYLIDKSGKKDTWCGATFDLRNNVWIINRQKDSGGILVTGRSSSGVFWQVTNNPDSSIERYCLIASSSFGSVIMSGNNSQEYVLTTQGGDEGTWQNKALGYSGYYQSVKCSRVICNGVEKEALLFISKGQARMLLSSASGNNDVEYIRQAKVLNSLGIDITPTRETRDGEMYMEENPSDNCGEIEVVIKDGVENLFVYAYNQTNTNCKVVWIRKSGSDYSLVSSYDFGNVPVPRLKYHNGKLCCYTADLGTTALQRSAYILNVDFDANTLTLDHEYENCHSIIATRKGIVEIRHDSVIVDGTNIQLPYLSGEKICSFAYDGDNRVIVVTGTHIYQATKGNIALCIDLDKKKVMNNDNWEEISLIAEDSEGIIVNKESRIKTLNLDERLTYSKDEVKLSIVASDRTTDYSNYRLKGYDSDVWCKVPLAQVVNNSTKVYSDENCTTECGVIKNHGYNTSNPNDVEVLVGGVSVVFSFIDSKTPTSVATTKAVIDTNTKVAQIAAEIGDMENILATING